MLCRCSGSSPSPHRHYYCFKQSTIGISGNDFRAARMESRAARNGLYRRLLSGDALLDAAADPACATKMASSFLHSSTLHDRSSNQSSKRDIRQGCGPPIHTLNQSPIERYCCCCCCVVVMVRPHRTIYIPRPACLRSSPVRPVRMNQECRHRTSSFCRSIVITYTDQARGAV